MSEQEILEDIKDDIDSFGNLNIGSSNPSGRSIMKGTKVC